MSTPWFRFIFARFSFFHTKYRLNNSKNSKNNVLYFPFFGNLGFNLLNNIGYIREPESLRELHREAYSGKTVFQEDEILW